MSQIFLVEKNDGGQRPVINLKGLNQLSEARALQDGGPSSPTRSSPTRGLDDQNGPEGCIPPGPNTFRPSTTSNLPLGRKTLLPIFQSVIYTEGIHKINETDCRVSKADWLLPNNISG